MIGAVGSVTAGIGVLIVNGKIHRLTGRVGALESALPEAGPSGARAGVRRPRLRPRSRAGGIEKIVIRVDLQVRVRQNRRTMGEIRARVTLENRDDRGAVHLGLRVEADVRRTTVEGVVDTRAVSLVIPEEIATELGLRHWGTRTVVYADERRDERPVTDVTIEIGNLATRTEAIVGPAGSEVLIGQVVLEMLDLVADCRNRTLTPRHPEGPVLAIRRARTPRQLVAAVRMRCSLA